MDELKEIDRKLRRLRLHIIKLTVIWYGVQVGYLIGLFASAVIFFDPIQASLFGHEKLLGLGSGWWWMSVGLLIIWARAFQIVHKTGAYGSINKRSESESDDEE